MNLESIESLLETYTLEEIFELNDLTEAEVLLYLIEHKRVSLPETLPLDFDDQE